MPGFPQVFQKKMIAQGRVDGSTALRNNVDSTVFEECVSFLLDSPNERKKYKENTSFNDRKVLLEQLKIRIKVLMEESVSKKFIHEDSGPVLSLCRIIDVCMLCGIKRSSLGFISKITSLTLIQRLAKIPVDSAEKIVNMMREIPVSQGGLPNSSGSSNVSFDVSGRPSFHSATSQDSMESSSQGSKGSPGFYSPSGKLSFSWDGARKDPYQIMLKTHLWIRLALKEKLLIEIVQYLISHYKDFYHIESILGNIEHSSIFMNLLMGPSALDYSRMRTVEHLWTDPHADELIQRHKLQNSVYTSSSVAGSHQVTPLETVMSSSSTASEDFGDYLEHNFSRPPHNNNNHDNNSVSGISMMSKSSLQQKKPALIVKNVSMSGGYNGDSSCAADDMNASAKECVESLHQTQKFSRVYGKNNVYVQPDPELDKMPGYLSLDSTSFGSFILRWTPNQLINGGRDKNTKDSVTSMGSLAKRRLSSDQSCSSTIFEVTEKKLVFPF